MKKFLFIVIIVTFAKFGNAQFLHLGVGMGGSKMQMQLNVASEYKKWYFANAENEVIEILNITPDKSMKLTGNIYGNYILRNNFFVRTDMQYFYNESNVDYINSVDTITYISVFKGITGHSSMKFRYYFVSNNLDFGYLFFPTKVLRPYLSAGIGMLTCLNIVQVGDYFDNLRYDRNSYIRREMIGFRRISAKASINAGLRYHTLSTEAYVTGNVGNIDFYKEAADKTYKSYLMYGFSVKYDLFTFNLASKATKLKIKELGKFN